MQVNRDVAAGAVRARWLGALAEALGEAQRVSALLVRAQPANAEIRSLPVHIQALQTRVETLQRAVDEPFAEATLDPLWSFLEHFGTRAPISVADRSAPTGDRATWDLSRR